MDSQLRKTALVLAAIISSSLISRAAPVDTTSAGITVSLPTTYIDTSVPIDTIIIQPVASTNINPSAHYIGFQGDFTYDPTVISFRAPPSQPAGLTASGWTVSATSIPTNPPSARRVFRVSAFSNDGVTPLSGLGTLFSLRFQRMSTSPGTFTALTWRPSGDDFQFIDTDLNSFSPNQLNGFIGITGACAPVTQGFDNITTLPGAGWAQINNSQPGPGITNWFQGVTAAFQAQSGPANSYLAASYENGTGLSTLSNWLLTPSLALDNASQLAFWTRTVNNPALPDRLQVRMSTNGPSTNVGATATSVGDFTTLLLDINPTYTLTDYPNVWTRFTVTISGLPAPTLGRLAFRYFVENAGPLGTNSDYIGIDTVEYTCPVATPTPSPTPVPITISGSIPYCPNPVPGPVANVTLTLTGGASGTTLSDGTSNYLFSLPPGGTYTVTPTKAALAPASAGINTVDVLAAQRHFTSCSSRPETCLSACKLTAADVNGDGSVNTVDVIAIQRFSLGYTTAIANVGKYRFIPANRAYSVVTGNQTAQNFDALILGDVASHFAE